MSDFNVEDFQQSWLESPKFNIAEVIAILKESKMIQQYFEVSELKNVPFNDKIQKLESILKSDAFFAIKQEIIYQLAKVPFAEKEAFIDIVLESKNIHLRQTIAESTTDFPEDFKSKYQSFLDDESYITKEIALNVLWNKYPDEQSQLLEKTKNWIGFNDFNLRILWLNLALRTKEYVLQDKTLLYDELLRFSNNNYETETRQNAIKTLLFLDKNDQNVLPNLVNSLTSHRWQMVKFAKDNMRPMLKNKVFRTFFEKLVPNLNENESVQLNKLLAEK